ncbi:hypothetical protein BH24ACT15_BH24ACT15_36390 [soil metagenome]
MTFSRQVGEGRAIPDNPLQYFLGQRNAACVRLLEQNEDVSTFIRALLEHLVDFANHEGIAARDVRIDRPFVSDDGYLKARITR